MLWLVPVALAAPSRAYELVSPAEKGGNDVGHTPESGTLFTPFSSPDGETAVFSSLGAFPGAVSNGVVNIYQADRGAAGWSLTQLSPPMDPVLGLSTSFFSSFSSDFGQSVFSASPAPPLTPDAAEGTSNLYLREADGSYRLLTPGAPENNPNFLPEFASASDDYSHIALMTREGTLTPDSPEGLEILLYDWSAATGAVKLVGRLPSNLVAPASVTIAIPPGTNNSSVAEAWNAVSANGSRIFFYTPSLSNEQQLYVRVGGTSTQEVSRSRATVTDPKGPKPAQFRIASDDGSRVFFTSSQKLTDDATTGVNDAGSDLYRYNTETEALTDITVDALDANGAQVRGVLGGSEDGSRLYFVAKGKLATGAVAGSNNLYSWVDDGSAKGKITLVAVGADEANWVDLGTFASKHPPRVTADGMHLMFVSTSSLTGYPNAGHFEAYLYDAGSGQLRCATCNPKGTPATADALPVGSGDDGHMAKTLSPAGTRLFFSTAEALVEADTNNQVDTYEYDAETNQVSLISSGRGDTPSYFADASADGRDVFFTTFDHLVGIDQDENYDVYDARVGGGIAAQNPPPPPPPCLSGGECRTATALPAVTAPGSSTLNGPGNQKPRRKHKKHKPAHKSKGKGKQHHKRQANHRAQG